jgi:copper chaperone CopZ
MQTTTLNIIGMHCDGCVQIVKTVIEQQPGVRGCSVSLEVHEARVAHDAAESSSDAIVEAIRKAGYTAISSTS